MQGVKWMIGGVVSALVFLSAAASAEELVPDNVIRMPESVDRFMLVEKDTQTFFVFGKKADGTLALEEKMACGTGSVVGDKRAEGDRKTPEGVYFFLTEYPDRYLAPIYGTRAFPIDYPNPVDVQDGKTGSAIWLHGTNRKLEDRMTNGCVALENGKIDSLKSKIQLKKTPVAIVRSVEWQSRDAARTESAEILKLVSDWYIGLGVEDYQNHARRLGGMDRPPEWWAEWVALRKRGNLRIEARNMGIFKAGSHYTIALDEVLCSPSMEWTVGRRKLYLARKEGGFRLVGTGYLSPEGGEEPAFMARARDAVKMKRRNADIETMLTGWIAAWESMDVVRYGGFYATGFRNRGRDRKAWLAYKAALNKRYEFIRIGKGPVRISGVTEDRAVVRFAQEYESDAYHAKGVKRLDLRREGGSWKIFRESWKGK